LGFKLFVFLIISVRLYYLQIIKESKYKTLSDSNRIRFSVIPPLRGIISDVNSKELAINQNYYRILLNIRKKTDLRPLLSKLSYHLGLNYEEQEELIQTIQNKKPSRGTILIYDHLNWQQIARVSANAHNLPGLSIDIAQIRFYPNGYNYAHIIGYVSTISKKEKENSDNPLYDNPDFKIGKRGIEKYYDSTLQGKSGVKQLEVNAHGLPVRELSNKESTPGDNISLTINIDIQNYVMSLLKEQNGSVVVMDVDNGDVLAMCSSPSFDPNKFTYGISSGEWNNLINNQDKPLLNRAIASSYPPGSTFKLITALAIQEAGISRNKLVYCPGYYTLGRRRFHCWKEDGHGYVNLRSAIKTSCNTYFYDLSQRIGIDAIVNIANKLDFNSKTNINILGEISNNLPTREWKQRRFNQRWQKGDTLNTAIGQGYVSATPVKLAAMMASLANKYKLVVPNLTKDNNHAAKFKNLDINPTHISYVLDAMEAVTNEVGGTAYGSRIWDKKYAFAGKTGTAQVVSKSVNEGIDEADIIKRNKNHAIFVGYAPLKKPKYAISVIMEHGGSGSRVAAPVARDVLHMVQKYYDGKYDVKKEEA
ncbi:MAG: penicillin-binding protein 2, partial [Pseudomonadota bacterium]